MTWWSSRSCFEKLFSGRTFASLTILSFSWSASTICPCRLQWRPDWSYCETSIIVKIHNNVFVLKIDLSEVGCLTMVDQMCRRLRKIFGCAENQSTFRSFVSSSCIVSCHSLWEAFLSLFQLKLPGWRTRYFYAVWAGCLLSGFAV